MIRRTLGKAQKSLSQVGCLETLLRILHRFKIISVLHSFEFTLKELGVRDGVLILNSFDGPGDQRVCQINGYSMTLREIKEEEIESLRFAEEIFPVETFREHFRRGMRFFAGFEKGTVVAVSGVHTKYAHLSYIKRSAFRLPDGVTYFNCAMTSPGYRNLGIGTVLRTFLLCQMRREGYQEVVAAVFAGNSGALRWNSTNGFERWGRISYLRWQGRDYWLKRLTKVGRRRPYLFDRDVEETHLPQEVAKEGGDKSTTHFAKVQIDLTHRTEPFHELSYFEEDTELLQAAQACVHFHKAHEKDSLKSEFKADSQALDKVSVQALNSILQRGENIHGVTTDREISNCIAYNIGALADSVSSDELNVIRLRLDRMVRSRLKELFRGPFRIEVFNSGHFYYPAGAFMSWHTNARLPGWRFYINYAEEPGKSFFRYRDPRTGEIITSTDRKWSFRLFLIDAKDLLWHAVYSEAPRYSFGYRIVLEPNVSFARRVLRKVKRLSSELFHIIPSLSLGERGNFGTHLSKQIVERKQVQCVE